MQIEEGVGDFVNLGVLFQSYTQFCNLVLTMTKCFYQETFNQGRSQSSEQDEASFERQRREPPERGLGACPPPPHLPPENFEIWRFRNALLTIFRGIFFLQKSQTWAKSRRGLVLPHASYGPVNKTCNWIARRAVKPKIKRRTSR